MNIKGNFFDNTTSPWESGSSRLWSLWDMIIFFVQPLVRNMCALQESLDKLQELMNQFPDDLPNTTLSEEILEKFNQDLNIIHNGIESSGLISAAKSIKHVLMRLSDTTFVR